MILSCDVIYSYDLYVASMQISTANKNILLMAEINWVAFNLTQNFTNFVADTMNEKDLV